MEEMTDKQYASSLAKDVRELEKAIKVAESENAAETLKYLTMLYNEKQEQLDIMLSKK